MVLNLIAAVIALGLNSAGAVRGTLSSRPVWAAFAALAALNIVGCSWLLATGAAAGAGTVATFYAGVAVPEWLLSAVGAWRSIRTHARVMTATGQLDALVERVQCIVPAGEGVTE